MKKVFFVLFLLCLALPASAAEPVGLSVSERYSYAMGVRLGQLLKQQGIQQLDSKAFAAAIDEQKFGKSQAEVLEVAPGKVVLQLN